MQTGVSTMAMPKSGVTTAEELCGVRQVTDGVIFTACFPQARTVQVAGDFNNWQPQETPMQKFGGDMWQVKLRLAKGVYRYRLVVDGHWEQDPCNKMTEPNPYGGLNSVLKVD